VEVQCDGGHRLAASSRRARDRNRSKSSKWQVNSFYKKKKERWEEAKPCGWGKLAIVGETKKGGKSNLVAVKKTKGQTARSGGEKGVSRVRRQAQTTRLTSNSKKSAKEGKNGCQGELW